jgi:hypothetical protein
MHVSHFDEEHGYRFADEALAPGCRPTWRGASSLPVLA